MKKSYHLTITALLAFFALPVLSQNADVIDLHQLVKQNGIEVYNRELSQNPYYKHTISFNPCYGI
jgi:hypothetical protein